MYDHTFQSKKVSDVIYPSAMHVNIMCFTEHQPVAQQGD